jgi:hypothetical protein
MSNKPATPRLFAFLSLGFIIATIVGTLSHELGHVAVAKALGYKTELHYASMNYSVKERWDALDKYYFAHTDAVTALTDSPQKKYYDTENAAIEKDMFKVTLGGPLQTLLTGTVGLVLLWLRRKKIKQYGLAPADWVYIFLAFFWSRQIFNCAFGLLAWVRHGKLSGHSDEGRIDYYLNLPVMTTDLVGAIIAMALLIWVTFFVIPRPQRLMFIVAGFLGSAAGFFIWMQWLGPALLP